ncbi:MAG: MBL fold metallo-hydrolase [Anaerolineae bacterium]|jgi:L-ascorbate metabolism protein UlaG (beta-lactamase superfamily)|nr:MBL fold metallo-hydrolase [Anaerolineae bacterium]
MPQNDALIYQIETTPILPNSLAIWGLGQMGFIIKGTDGIIYIDPCLSNTISSRAFPAPIQPSAITHADYVLCSHEHIDHFDVHTLAPMLQASPQAKIVTTRWCIPLIEELHIPLEQVIFPNSLEPFTLPNTTCKVTSLPSAHYGLDYAPEKGYRWLGFLIEWNGITIYFAGDTILYDGLTNMLKGLPHANIAILPVNGRDYYREAIGLAGNLHPREASQFARDMNWDLVLIGHNDMLPINTVPMGDIAQAFANDCPRQAYKLLQAGELLYYVR